MIVASHIVSSGVIGEITGNPVAAFLLGFVFHFVLDAIPHFDNLDGGKWTVRQIIFTIADFLLTLYLVFFVVHLPLNFNIFTNAFVWGAFGGFLPDLIDNVPFWNKAFRATVFGHKFHRFHDGLHKLQPGIFFGMLTQVAVIAIFLVIHFVIK